MTIHKQDGSTQTINYTDAANITALQLDTVDTSVTEIKNNFLRGCTGLSGKLDLSFLSNITKIDDHFLQGCSTINELDLTPLANVKTIGNYFLNDCTALATVNFNVLSNLTSIGGYFLSGCTTLPASLSFSNLNKVTKIGERFLQNCTTLTSVDLSGFVNVTEIGYYFLRGCTSLLNIDMSNMISLGKVDEGFLWGIGSNDPVRRIQSLILPQRAVWNLVSWGNTNTGSTDDEVKAELAKLFGDAGESAAKLIHCGGYLKQYKTYENNRMWKLARDYMTE